MSELSAKLAKKEELLAQIRRIEESCEGIENEANARRVAELNEQQMRISAEKRDLQERLSVLESQLTGISSKIQELSGTGIDKILEAIKKQRWFFFTNKPHIMFDKVTGLLWPNLNYYNIGAGDRWGQCTGRFEYNCDVSFLKTLEIDGIKNWELPTLDDCIRTLNDETFPFYHCQDDEVIYDHSIRTNHSSKKLYIHTLRSISGYGVRIDRSVESFYSAAYECGVFPYSDSLTNNTEYMQDVASDNNRYSNKQKLQRTLDLFLSNDLVPVFTDDSIIQLYRQIYIEKPALLQQLSELQSEINALQEVVLLSSTFDYHGLLASYDIPAINSSVIKYHEAVTSLAVAFLDKVREYEGVKKTTIREFDAAGMKFGVPYREHPELSETENETLEAGRSFLAHHLALNMDSVKQQIRAVKAQGEAIASQIAAINRGKNPLGELAQLASEKRPDFALVAENLAAIVRNALIKIEFFEASHDFALQLIKLWWEWEADCIDFKTQQREGFRTLCSDHGLPTEWCEARYAEWAMKRLAVEQAFLPLTEYALQGNLLEREGDEPTPAEKALSLLQSYREDMDSFYREELWKLHTDFGSDADYGRKEKLETEMAFYWRTAHWLKGEWKDWLFSLPDEDQRLFLARWTHPLIATPAAALLDYARVHDELPLPANLVAGLMEIQDPAGRGSLENAKAYEDELNQRGNDLAEVIEKLKETWPDAPAPGHEAEDDMNVLKSKGQNVTISKVKK